MAEDFIGMEIAVMIVIASITLAGILIGLGKAFGYKRIEQFGVEEFIQSVINAAIIGSFAAIIGLVGVISSSIVTTSCSEGTIVDQLVCSLTNINTGLFSTFQELVITMNILGYYQSLSLDFGSFAISPFVNLSSISGVLSSQLFSLSILMMLVELNIQIANFIGQNALGLLFPVGLVLRTLFATRKVGGFLIALGVGLYIFYPAFVLIFPSPVDDVNISTIAMQGFNNNSYYSTVPVIDLNDNYAIAGKLDVLSGRCAATNMSNTSACLDFMEQNNITNMTLYTNLSTDFTGDLTFIAQSNTNTLSKSLLYTVIAPLFSFIITIVFVRELSTLLGGELGLKTFAAI
ncbi:hypothetical protein KKF81_04235 [Candidatus Micrarchaeota archaeon]|nr:hypothetical protein [Candidatus Micrarchaeota archaeon]MBU1166134.1 hypothetical protein [Candidatus Micrarchaeota archaeon]MBU1887323.1 hypothetical protein [Candidatus Micrarchaeota archaeon]